MEQIFKLGDHVYHWLFGWGKVTSVLSRKSEHPIRVMFNSITIDFTIDGKHGNEAVSTLSFTEYNLITGGFSQVRPMPDLKTGNFIWVLDDHGEWLYRKFLCWNGTCTIVTVSQKAKIVDDIYCNAVQMYSKIWSIECPVNTK